MYEQDKALVERLIRGESSAFDEFFADLSPRLYAFALTRVSREKETAEDVVQDTLSLVVRKLHTYRGEAPLFSWVCTLCRRRIGKLWRSNARKPALSLDEATPEIHAVLHRLSILGEDTPEHETLKNEVADVVHSVLRNLPHPYGVVLRWKYLEDLPVKQIGMRLEKSPKAAESLLTRARMAFKVAYWSAGNEAPTRGQT